MGNGQNKDDSKNVENTNKTGAFKNTFSTASTSSSKESKVEEATTPDNISNEGDVTVVVRSNETECVRAGPKTHRLRVRLC